MVFSMVYHFPDALVNLSKILLNSLSIIEKYPKYPPMRGRVSSTNCDWFIALAP
jgi:hypothetical protein